MKLGDPRPLIGLIDTCVDNSMDHEWARAVVDCQTCGYHEGFVCDVCQQVVDWETDPEEYEIIDQELP